MLLNSVSPKIYLPIVYIIVSIIIYNFISIILKKIFINKKFDKLKSEFQKKKELTIVSLIKNIIKYLIGIIAILSILNVYGVKTTSIIASIGIAGAIIGLAFQDIIKNFLAGITIIFDNHFMQGDYVTINGFKGEVIELGLQTTKVKAYNGEVMIIGNSLITSVINHSMFNTKLILELPISKEVSISVIENILNKTLDTISTMKEVKNTCIKGIEKLNSNNYIYKVEIDCEANNQFSVNREFMKILKENYDKKGIEINPELIEFKGKLK